MHAMTATQVPPAAKQTMDAVREGLADIRDRISDMETLPSWDKLALPDWDRVAENTQDLIDRATGRQRRRPPWPLVALGVVAVIGIAAAITMFMMNRTSVDQLADELESDVDQPWTPGSTTSSGARTADSGVSSFPASDPTPSPMSPSVGS
jgi:hypothetical protein